MEDFDLLARKAYTPEATLEDKNALFAAVFALPQWHFIARGVFPNVHPYIARHAEVADGQYMIRAFTDTERLSRFAREWDLVQEGQEVMVLSLPTETIVEYLESYIEQKVHGIWFNSDSASTGFFAPLKQLRPIREFLK